jgi:serine phosphatase RsbU (regulator of sigma subunit)
VIASFATGNTDFFASPYGSIPGGYVLASIANAVLTNAWLRDGLGDDAATLAAGAMGAALGAVAGPYSYWLLVTAALGVWFGCAQAAFAWASVFVPWFFPAAALSLASATTYAAQRYSESRRRLHLEHEARTASALQRQFFPPLTAEHERYALAAFYYPAEAVGGDWYAHRLVDGRYLHLHVGDVTGHGTSAALLASFATGALDMAYAAIGPSAGDAGAFLMALHAKLNGILCGMGRGMSLMTLVSVAIDLDTGAAFCLNAGHRPVLVIDGTRRSVRTPTRSNATVLGYLPVWDGTGASRFQLAGDEVLLLMSDGLLDVPTSRGVRTTERSITRLLAGLCDQSPSAMRERMAEELRLGQSERLPGYPDDVTFVVVKLTALAAWARCAVA